MLTLFVLSIDSESATDFITCKGISRGGARVAYFFCHEEPKVRVLPPHPNIRYSPN